MVQMEIISEIYPDILFIPGQRDGKYPYSHSLLLKDTLIDTGISSGFLRKLRRKTNIKNVILSHWHEDHISGNRLFPHARFLAHKKDIHIIENVSKMYEFYEVTVDSKQWELFKTILGGLRLENISINAALSDNDIISINNSYILQVVHTPGHTKGHCCFYEEDAKIAFLADIDLSSFGPWYGGRDSDVRAFEESIKKIMELDIEIAISSHKGTIRGSNKIQRKLYDYLNKIYERDENILDSLSEITPRTSEDLINKNIIYPKYSEYKVYELLAEKIMIDSHFEKLIVEDKIKVENNGYILS
jgi:glyoxylase-like metal-dependent hydrolase (beta-lactamase superfamily II)